MKNDIFNNYDNDIDKKHRFLSSNKCRVDRWNAAWPHPLMLRQVFLKAFYFNLCPEIIFLGSPDWIIRIIRGKHDNVNGRNQFSYLFKCCRYILFLYCRPISIIRSWHVILHLHVYMYIRSLHELTIIVCYLVEALILLLYIYVYTYTCIYVQEYIYIYMYILYIYIYIHLSIHISTYIYAYTYLYRQTHDHSIKR